MKQTQKASFVVFATLSRHGAEHCRDRECTNKPCPPRATVEAKKAEMSMRQCQLVVSNSFTVCCYFFHLTLNNLFRRRDESYFLAGTSEYLQEECLKCKLVTPFN